jgi:ABC-type branched-subunit amino acid transport system ATPase component
MALILPGVNLKMNPNRTEPLLVVKDLSLRFGGLFALNNINIQLNTNESLGMIGPNGSGKSSFVNVLTGHFRPFSGEMFFANQSMIGLSPHQLVGMGLCRTYQAVRVFGNLSVKSNIETAKLLYSDIGISHEQYEHYIDWLKLGSIMDKLAKDITLFEQRKLELMMRLVLKPKLIMLDEPVGGLATSEVSEMIQLLKDLKSYSSIFVIEHTMRVIREIADRVVVLIAGEKIADGNPIDILRNQRVINEYLGSAHA